MKMLSILIVSTCLYAQKPVGLYFPPIASPADMHLALQHSKTLGVKSVRFSENWKLREPTQNVWNWAGLDYRIDSLHNAGISIFLTVESDGPAWRCGIKNPRSCVYNDLRVFSAYVDTLVRRYKGRISYMQFGNESFSSYWYAGASSEFVTSANAFYLAVKAADPGVTVVLSGMQSSAIHDLAVCQYGRSIPSRNSQGELVSAASWCADSTNKAMLQRIGFIFACTWYDMVDVHLYDNMEYWKEYLDVVRYRFPGRILMATEMGTPNKRYEPQDDAYHAARVGLLLSILPSLKLYEAFYFKMVEYPEFLNSEHEKSGLIGYPELDVKPAYDSVRIYNSKAN